MIAVVAIALLSVSCGKEHDETKNPSVITAKDVINSSSDIAMVKAVMDSYRDEEIIATANYEKDGFKLTLPKTVPNECLMKVGDEFGDEEWVEISDPSAKLGVTWVYAFDKKDKEIGDFYFLGITTRSYVAAMYIYADKKFTMKGKIDEDSYIDEYNCSFNKGWNVLYFVESMFESSSLITTQKPADVKLEWVFEDSWWKSQNEHNSVLQKHTTLAKKRALRDSTF